MAKSKIQYISGLKGLACLGVMIGHFAGVIQYIESDGFESIQAFLLSARPVSMLVSEIYWLYLFFIASGFLLALSKIEKFTKLMSKIFTRFLRLGLPILFSSLFVFIIIKTIGINSDKTSVLFINNWYQGMYDYIPNFWNVLLSPFDVLFFRDCVFNSPFWVLKDMFIASIIIYCCTYLQSKTKNIKLLTLSIPYVFLIGSIFISKIIFSCILGCIIAQNRDNIYRLQKKAKWIGLCFIIVGVLVSIYRPKPYSAILLFSSIIAFTPYLPKLEKVLSTSLLNKVSNISFGIYSFHWPVVCSVGACVLIQSWALGYAWAFTLCFIISTIVTIAISILFYFTAEKGSSMIIKRL